MKRFLFVLTFYYSGHAGICQFDSTDLKNWNEYSLPIDSASLVHYNWSTDDWVVTKSGNSVHAIRQTGSPLIKVPFKLNPSGLTEEIFMGNPQAIIKVGDGYLISFYRGEFGGYLYWFSTDGIQKKRISRALIVQFIERDNKIYAIDGVDHMGLNIGSIRELKKTGQGWTNIEYLDLPVTPYSILKDKAANFIIVTSENIISVDRNKHLKILFADGFWRNLYPTSMVMNKGTIYVGMRRGVFKYNPQTDEKKWLMRD